MQNVKVARFGLDARAIWPHTHARKQNGETHTWQYLQKLHACGLCGSLAETTTAPQSLANCMVVVVVFKLTAYQRQQAQQQLLYAPTQRRQHKRTIGERANVRTIQHNSCRLSSAMHTRACSVCVGFAVMLRGCCIAVLWLVLLCVGHRTTAHSRGTTVTSLAIRDIYETVLCVFGCSNRTRFLRSRIKAPHIALELML